MENLIHADIFFLISSIGFIILGSVFLVVLIYFILFLRTVTRIARKIESGIDTAEEEIRELLNRLYESRLFGWFLSPRKSTRKSE